MFLDKVLLCAQADVNYKARLQQHYWGGDKGGKQEQECICKDCWKSDTYTKLSILSLIQTSNRSPEKGMSRTRIWWYLLLLTLDVIFLKQGGILECCRHQQISIHFSSHFTILQAKCSRDVEKKIPFCLLGSFCFLISFHASQSML